MKPINRLIRILFVAVSFLLTGMQMNAQTEISGTVNEASGTPIPGANIVVRGSTSGTTTDFDGNFVFTTELSGEQVLQISYLGFVTHNESINLSGSPIQLQIVLQEAENQLDEVVLTASSTFRSQKEAPLSISSVKQAEITKLSINSQA
ncbi:MAG: carboxypeptidase-like regulatory domain-containing protein, partial [Flavobacteriaceae bacterium]